MANELDTAAAGSRQQQQPKGFGTHFSISHYLYTGPYFTTGRDRYWCKYNLAQCCLE